MPRGATKSKKKKKKENQSSANNDAGGPGSHCGRRYKYGMGKDKEEPCGVGLEMEISEKLVSFNICFLVLSVEGA